MDDDDLTLRVSTCARSGSGYTLSNPRTLGGWQEVVFGRGVERCPSGFQVTMTDRYPINNPPEMQVQPGDYCEVFLGADKVMTGWIDRLLPSFDRRNHSLTLTGRSKCQDLVDCAAVYEGYQISDAPVLFIATELCRPFGIRVSLAPGTNQGDTIPQVVILAGETAYDIIERVCRYRAMLLYDTPDGNLLLSGIGLTNAASGFQEGINVQRASAMIGQDQRFSDYYALYQGIDQFGDTGGAPNQIAHLTDSTVQRYRPHVVLAESVWGGSVVAEQRAQWELARRLGRSYSVQLTTDSWRDAKGTLYTPNTLAPLILPSLKLGTEQAPLTWLISDVTYKKGREGTECELVLMPPAAFYQEPIILIPFAPDQAPS